MELAMRKLVALSTVALIALFSCGGGGGSKSPSTGETTTVTKEVSLSGRIKLNTTRSFSTGNINVAYVVVTSIDNGAPITYSAEVKDDGTFSLVVLSNRSYVLSLFDQDGNAVASTFSNKVEIDAPAEIIVSLADSDGDGIFDDIVVNPKKGARIVKVQLADRDGDLIPDEIEDKLDHDGNGKIDVVEELIKEHHQIVQQQVQEISKLDERQIQEQWYSYLHKSPYPVMDIDEVVKNYPCHIEVNLDDSLPETEKDFVLEYHSKLCSVLRYITGRDPHVSFVMSYDPGMHRSWNSNLTHLYASILPTKDPFFKSWYSVELAHLYVVHKNDKTRMSNDWSYLRPNETLSQTLTSVVAYYYGKQLGFSDGEYKFYSQQLKPNYYYAIDNFVRNTNPFIIYQTDVNYNMNANTLSASAHQILTLFLADPNFFKNLLQSSYSWSSGIDLKMDFARSVKTLPFNVVNAYVDSMPYFKQLDQSERPERMISIVLLSSTDTKNESASKISFGYCNIDAAGVLGESYKADNLGKPSYEVVPDPNFYGRTVRLEVVDLKSNKTVKNETSRILSNLDNGGFVYFPNLKVGNIYKVNATATIDGITYTDQRYFIAGTCLRSNKQVARVNEPVIFSLMSKAKFNQYYWDFNGDGTIDKITEVNTASYSYSQPGIYYPKVGIEVDFGNEEIFWLDMPPVFIKK